MPATIAAIVFQAGKCRASFDIDVPKRDSTNAVLLAHLPVIAVCHRGFSVMPRSRNIWLRRRSLSAFCAGHRPAGLSLAVGVAVARAAEVGAGVRR